MAEPKERRAWIAGALWVGIPALLILVGGLVFLLWPRTQLYYTDGTRSWPAGPGLGLRTVLWDDGAPLEIVGELGEDYDPCLAADGQSLYFTRGRAGGDADIYRIRKTHDGWSAPEPLAELNTDHDEIGPAVTPDGRRLFFYSNRPGGEGGYDLYVATHDGDRWTGPANLGPHVNSPYNDYDPSVTPDGLALLFACNRPTEEDEQPREGAWPATLREEIDLYDYDIYALDLEVDEAQPRRLERACSLAHDGQPVVSPDGRWLYFASDRDGGLGRYDLYRCRITAAPLGGLLPAENLRSPVNTAHNELDPAISLEGFGLFFSSDRAGDDTYRIYYAHSREVYVYQVTRGHRLGQIWEQLSWPLIGLILSLVGLALTLLLLAKFHKRPGLMVTAMMVSLVIHLIALSLFTLWTLSVRVYELVESEARFEVAVTVPGLAESEISSQLRTALTEMTRLDTAQFARDKTETITAPVAPQMAEPEVALARMEPVPKEIEIIRPDERPMEIAESLRPETAPAPTPDFLPVEAVEPIRTKPLRRADPTEPVIVAMAERIQRPAVRHELAPAPATDVPAPATESRVRSTEASPGPTLVKTQAPTMVPGGPWPVESIETKPVAPASPANGAEVLGPVDLVAAPSPAPASREALPSGGPGEVGPREMLPAPRAETAEPSPAPLGEELSRGVPLAAWNGRPGEKTLLASTAAAGPERVATPVIADAVRIAVLPPSTPVEADVTAAPEPLPLKEMYRLRTQPDRDKVIEKLGGTPETEEAVRRGLVFLARHQSPDGRWDVDGFMGNYNEGNRRADGGGNRGNQDIGVTALATLSFIGSGHTHVPAKGKDAPSEHAEPVRKAVDWIIKGQKENGDLRQGGQMYGHAMATMALAELYTMTGDERLVEPVRKAVQFIIDAQNPGSGWRYEPRNSNDTSVVGWQIMALKSAEIAGFPVPPKVYRGAANWLDQVRKGKHGGLYEYQPKRGPTPAMTAEGMFTEQFIEFSPHSPRTAESIAYLLKNKPRWNPRNKDETNVYYWYYATLSLHQLGGPEWDEWNQQIQKALVGAQRKDGPHAGSWDPATKWGEYGGRIYSTAVATLTLEVYYRYLPFYSLRLSEGSKEARAK